MNVFAVWLGACAKKICSTFCLKKGGKIFAAQNQFKGNEIPQRGQFNIMGCYGNKNVLTERWRREKSLLLTNAI